MRLHGRDAEAFLDKLSQPVVFNEKLANELKARERRVVRPISVPPDDGGRGKAG